MLVVFPGSCFETARRMPAVLGEALGPLRLPQRPSCRGGRVSARVEAPTGPSAGQRAPDRQHTPPAPLTFR